MRYIITTNNEGHILMFDELLTRADLHGDINTTQFLIAAFYSMSRSGVSIELSGWVHLDDEGKQQFNSILKYRETRWTEKELSQVAKKLSDLGYPCDLYLNN